MTQESITVIFFDLGDTLGDAQCDPQTGSLCGFRVYPDVPALLEELQTAVYRLGIISNTGEESGAHMDEVLDRAGVLPYFEAGLRIYSHEAGVTKASPEIFRLAAERAGLAEAPGGCLYVGDSAAERQVAREAGFAVCPDRAQVRERLGLPAARPKAPQARHH